MTDSKPSKSEQKRVQLALQSLGEQLIDLPDELIGELDLDETLLQAIADYRRMKSHEARRRQRQYIGKLMREVDPAPIRQLLDQLRAEDRREKRVFATAERWRDRLVNDGSEALRAFETDIGKPVPALQGLLDELEHSYNDTTERALRRQIFRQIHAALVARAADG